MKYLKLEKSKLDDLIAIEESLRDNSPEHTLDWYTYDNRVSLLKEVLTLTTEIKEEVPKTKKDPKVKTVSPDKPSVEK